MVALKNKAKPTYQIINQCEICHNTKLETVLNLGEQPLCDDLRDIEDGSISILHPQEILFCSTCLTAHQKFQIPKEILFTSTYHYRAALTKDVTEGMKDFVEELISINPSKNPGKVLDIGCNDGSLLNIFRSKNFFTVGVDPTDAILDQNDSIDHPIKAYFDKTTSLYLKEKYQYFDYITFTNVFAHIENLDELCENLNRLVTKETVIAIENHYLGSIVDKKQFDTFYHEHPRTYSAKSFEYIAKKLDMSIKHISMPSRYGGNIRVFLSKNEQIPDSKISLDESLLENKLKSLQLFYEEWKKQTREKILELSAEGTIAGKSLPGRAIMLINSLNLSEMEMAYIFEKPGSPKIGKRIPNSKIVIKSDDELVNHDVKNIIIWAWHLESEISEYLDNLGYKGNIWTILPKFKSIN